VQGFAGQHLFEGYRRGGGRNGRVAPSKIQVRAGGNQEHADNQPGQKDDLLHEASGYLPALTGFAGAGFALAKAAAFF
jgi:hypothetical protein